MPPNTHILFTVLFVLFIFPVIAMPPLLSSNPDEMVTSRFAFLNLDLPADYSDIGPDIASEPEPQYENEGIPSDPKGEEVTVPTPEEPPVSVDSGSTGLIPDGLLGASAIAPNGRNPLNEQRSMGKGWVQAHFTTSVNSPGEMIDDRQRYMASGLFNVKIVHQFAG